MSREFYDPETASNSGLSHVPSQPMSIPSPRGMLSRDSCLQSDTQNSFGISGNVFENVLALNEPSAAFFGNSRRLATARRLAARTDELETHTQHVAIPTPRIARTFSTWSPPSHAEGAYPQNCMVEQPRNQVAEMHFDNFPDHSTFQGWKTSFKTEVCSCSHFPTEAMM